MATQSLLSRVLFHPKVRSSSSVLACVRKVEGRRSYTYRRSLSGVLGGLGSGGSRAARGGLHDFRGAALAPSRIQGYAKSLSTQADADVPSGLPGASSTIATSAEASYDDDDDDCDDDDADGIAGSDGADGDDGELPSGPRAKERLRKKYKLKKKSLAHMEESISKMFKEGGGSSPPLTQEQIDMFEKQAEDIFNFLFPRMTNEDLRKFMSVFRYAAEQKKTNSKLRFIKRCNKRLPRLPWIEPFLIKYFLGWMDDEEAKRTFCRLVERYKMELPVTEMSFYSPAEVNVSISETPAVLLTLKASLAAALRSLALTRRGGGQEREKAARKKGHWEKLIDSLPSPDDLLNPDDLNKRERAKLEDLCRVLSESLPPHVFRALILQYQNMAAKMIEKNEKIEWTAKRTATFLRHVGDKHAGPAMSLLMEYLFDDYKIYRRKKKEGGQAALPSAEDEAAEQLWASIAAIVDQCEAKYDQHKKSHILEMAYFLLPTLTIGTDNKSDRAVKKMKFERQMERALRDLEVSGLGGLLTSKSRMDAAGFYFVPSSHLPFPLF